MKFFTRELILQLNSTDDVVADAADAAWEQAIDRHEEQLQAIRPHLPPTFSQLWDNYFLHDAEVLSMGWQDQRFVIVLRLDVPPQDLLVLDYQLTQESRINTDALPPEARCRPPQWLYDEIGWVPGEPGHATHTILFCNGWEVELHLRDLQLISAQTLLPASNRHDSKETPVAFSTSFT